MPIEKIKEAFKGSYPQETALRNLITGLDHFEIARRFHELNLEQKIQIFHLLEDDEKRQKLLFWTTLRLPGDFMN